MRYRVLLMGNNQSIVNDFFLQLSDCFECQSTSNRFDDIACHLKYFQPDIFIYCMTNETRETMTQMVTIKRDKVQRRTPFAIIATQEDCDEFRRLSVDTADLELIRPISTAQIRAKLLSYLERSYGSSRETAAEMQAEQPMPSNSSEQSLFNELDSLLSGGPGTGIAAGASLSSAPQKAPGKRHILVVDDDFRMLKLIKRYLDGSYDVATAVSGKVAHKFLETKSTDLILLDYEMPDENGPAVFQKLRENPFTSNIPVVFLTGINDAKKIRQVLSLKPQGYLLKPIDHDKLIETIQDIIG